MAEEPKKEEQPEPEAEPEPEPEATKPEEAPVAGGDAEEEKEEKIYQDTLPNRVIVARNHPLSYYVDRARRILRMEEELFVSGRGNTISMACTLVEVLKRQKIAEIASVATGMNVEPFFNRSGDPRWSSPTAMITFSLKRGDFAEYIADYHQRKIIEIFEWKDKNVNKDAPKGVLSIDEIKQLKMAANFKANENQQKEANAFLQPGGPETAKTELDLPNFIKYASFLIHPLLRDKVFKDILADKYSEAIGNEKGGGGMAAATTTE